MSCALQRVLCVYYSDNNTRYQKCLPKMCKISFRNLGLLPRKRLYKITILFHGRNFRKKNIENRTKLRYNYCVEFDSNPTVACPAGEMRYHYGKKSRNHFQRHPLPHHP